MYQRFGLLSYRFAPYAKLTLGSLGRHKKANNTFYSLGFLWNRQFPRLGKFLPEISHISAQLCSGSVLFFIGQHLNLSNLIIFTLTCSGHIVQLVQVDT